MNNYYCICIVELLSMVICTNMTRNFEIVNSHYLFEGVDSKYIGGDFVVSHEVDVINQHSPENITILASGKDIPCDLILIENESKFKLLNTSSIGSFHGLNEKGFRKFITNFIDHSLR